MTQRVADRAVEAAARVELLLGDLAEPAHAARGRRGTWPRGRRRRAVMPSKGITPRPPASFIRSSQTRTSSGSPSLTMPLPNLAWLVVFISSTFSRMHVVADDEVGQVADVVDRARCRPGRRR